jgi:protoheme IX farnesyltransferase
MPEGDARMVPAKKMFAYSVFYLFAIFSGLLADHVSVGVAGFVGGLL